MEERAAATKAAKIKAWRRLCYNRHYMTPEQKKKYDDGWNVGKQRGLRKSVEILFREMPRKQKLELLKTLLSELISDDREKLLAELQGCGETCIYRQRL